MCGSCLVESIQDGRPSAMLYGMLTNVEKETNRFSEECPVSELSHTIQKLCDIMCYVTADISRTYGLRFLFHVRGYISFDCLLKILNMLAERVEIDPDTWAVVLLIVFCLALPCKSPTGNDPAEASINGLLHSLPQYTRILRVYIETGGNEMLSGTLLLVYTLALRLSIALLGNHSLIIGHEDVLRQFHRKIKECIKLCEGLGSTDKIAMHDTILALLCQEAIFSIVPLKGGDRKKKGTNNRYFQGQIVKADKPDAEPYYKWMLASLATCFSTYCLDAIDFSSICYSSSGSAVHTIYSYLEPILSEAREGLSTLQQTIEQCNVNALINVFFQCQLHGTVTKAAILRLLSGIVATYGVQQSGAFFNSIPIFLRDAFLAELNTIAKLKLLQEDTASASIVVSGIISSKTSYSAYSACIDYLNEVIQHPFTHGTAELLSLPIIITRDDFPSFVFKIKFSSDDSANQSICNTKSILIMRHISSKLKQGRVSSVKTLVDLLITYCSGMSLFDATTWRELSEIIEEMIALNLEAEDWYRLFQLLSPLLHILFESETNEEGIKDQEIHILKSQMLDHLMKLTALYWRLKDCPSIALLTTAIDSLKLYGRGALNSMDSVLFWIILSHLVQSRKPFDIVGTVSFILTKLDLLQEEPDSAVIAQRYLAVLITILLGQAEEYRTAETGKNLYSQIWRHLVRTTGHLPSYSCEEEAFLVYALKNRGLLVQREESTRQRVQLVCAWFARKKQIRQQLGPSLTVQLSFLDVAQNYREVYPVIDMVFNRYKPEEYLTSLCNLPPIDTKAFCNIVGLSSVSPGFSTVFAELILCKLCYDRLQDAGVIGETDSSSSPLSRTEPSQAAIDALERLFKRTRSKQVPNTLLGILLVCMHLLNIDISSYSRTIIEAMLSARKADEPVDREVSWLYATLSLLLYINTSQDNLVTEMLSHISEGHASSRSDEDPIVILLAIVYHLRHPVTIESACEIGVAMGMLSIHMYRWHHVTPEYVVKYLREIEDNITHNHAVKAMIDQGFVFCPGETARKFTKLEEKLSWNAVIKGSNETGCLALAKRLLFLILTRQLYNKSKTMIIEKPTVSSPA